MASPVDRSDPCCGRSRPAARRLAVRAARPPERDRSASLRRAAATARSSSGIPRRGSQAHWRRKGGRDGGGCPAARGERGEELGVRSPPPRFTFKKGPPPPP